MDLTITLFTVIILYLIFKALYLANFKSEFKKAFCNLGLAFGFLIFAIVVTF